MSVEAGSVWRAVHPDGSEILVLALGLEVERKSFREGMFTVCLTVANGSELFGDPEVGELDSWPLGLADAWVRVL